MIAAKSRLVANLSTSFATVFVNAVISIALTPFMIHHIGLEAYGMLPLVISFTTFLQVGTSSMADSVSRFVALHFNRGDMNQSNQYFNSALGALLALTALLVVPTILIAVYFRYLFQVPAGRELEASYLFILVIISSLLTVLSAPFKVSAVITHHLYLTNLIEMGSRGLRALVIVWCFLYLTPTLTHIGLSYLGMGVFTLLGTVLIAKRLTPQLTPSPKAFRWKALRELSSMGSWIAVNQVGALLYLAMSYVLLNLLAGPEAVGQFSVIALWITLLSAIGGACSTVFAPICYEYVARSDYEGMVRQLRRAIRLLGLTMGCAIGLMCGFARPMLQVWLGAEFVDLWPLAWVLVGPWLFTIAVRPMFAVYRALDEVKVPAVVTVVLGVANIVGSVLLLSYTDLGVYAVAIPLSTCWLIKNLLFTPLFASRITTQRWSLFLVEVLPGAFMAAGLAAIGYFIASHMTETTMLSLAGVTLGLGGVYSLVCYQLVLRDDDRELLRSIIGRRRG